MTRTRRSTVIDPILELIEFHSQIVASTRFEAPVCDDPDDDKFLEAASAATAGYVITGDRALLRIKKYGRVEIIGPTQFLRILAR
jgi:predicted nucleic acid-binding protein